MIEMNDKVRVLCSCHHSTDW